ncbi:MAG: MFS transporter [Planctomycetia bacterium]|nr:MFS transporter [Planctomycetia bacterium]
MPLTSPQPDPTAPKLDAGIADIGRQPTIVRYGVLAFSVSMSVILYLDRMAIAVPVVAMQSDLNLDLAQIGDSVAAFFWCYALFQVPAGWLGDRWGGRRVLTLYVVAWSLAMAGLGFAVGFISLVLMRALLGIGQAGAYATTASFLRRWVPFDRRGFANSAVSLGGRAGGVMAHSLTPWLMVAVAHLGLTSDRWRAVFLAYGAIGLVWAWLFWRWFRDQPRLHPRCNAAEIALIEWGEIAGPANANPTSGALPLRALLTSGGLQRLALINFCVNVGWIFLATWMPAYLMKVHGKSETDAGLYTSFTAAAGMAGCLCGGFATDWLVRRVGLCWGRRIPGLISYGGAALGLSGCWALDDANAIVALLVVSSFLGDFALGAMWATYQDIGGPLAGTVLGWANMCGNIGAACAISVIGRLVEHYGWSATFAMSASAYLVGALTWFFVDPRVPIRVARQSLSDPSPSPRASSD